MDTLPLSAHALLPGNPLDYDHGFERVWRPLCIVLPVAVFALNSLVVSTAAFNAKSRMENTLFAWNGLFFSICIGNMLYSACVAGFQIRKLWTEQWEQDTCSQSLPSTSFS